MRMAPLVPLDAPLPDSFSGSISGSGKANSSLIRSLRDKIEAVEGLADDEASGELAQAIEELRTKMDKLEANISAQSQRLPGQLFRIGTIVLGWEDIILLLVLIVIFVSWIRGSMTTQDTLVTLMGAGAGGAWGIATGRGYSEPS